jgi:thiol-disulfide isomerase/thioredoxin
MKKTIIYCLLAMLWPYVSTNAQGQPKALSIGDAMPDIAVRQVLFFKEPTLYFQQFAGKLLILDLFHTSCGSCVQKLPRYDSLQKKFADSLQIVLVTTEPASKVQAYWKKSRFTQGIALPVITGDTLLQQMFPHLYISHEVWIGASGRVKAITGSDYVHEAHIKTALAESRLNWPIKNDLEGYNDSLAMLVYNPQQPEMLRPRQLQYSAMWEAEEGLLGSFSFIKESGSGTFRTRFINTPVISMYLASVGWLLRNEPNRIVWETVDRERLDPAASELAISDWMATYSKCYESVQSLTLSKIQRLDNFRKDLDKFLGLYGRLETRAVDCWLLQQIPGVTRQPAPAGTPRHPSAIPGTDSLRITTVSALVNELNGMADNLPVLDESESKKPVVLPNICRKDFSNIPRLQQIIEPYGFRLVPGCQPIEMLVISDAVKTGRD